MLPTVTKPCWDLHSILLVMKEDIGSMSSHMEYPPFIKSVMVELRYHIWNLQGTMQAHRRPQWVKKKKMSGRLVVIAHISTPVLSSFCVLECLSIELLTVGPGSEGKGLIWCGASETFTEHLEEKHQHILKVGRHLVKSYFVVSITFGNWEAELCALLFSCTSR